MAKEKLSKGIKIGEEVSKGVIRVFSKIADRVRATQDKRDANRKKRLIARLERRRIKDERKMQEDIQKAKRKELKAKLAARLKLLKEGKDPDKVFGELK
jgi:hypothetical protein